MFIKGKYLFLKLKKNKHWAIIMSSVIIYFKETRHEERQV